MPITDSPDNRFFTYQDPIVFNQAAPVQNTWYTFAEIDEAFRIYQVIVNVEDTNETVMIQALTADGVLIEGTDLALTFANAYYGTYAETILINRLALTADNPRQAGNKRSFYLEGKQIKLQIRKITAAGVGDLNALTIYNLYQ